jgi:hypothetical protein
MDALEVASTWKRSRMYDPKSANYQSSQLSRVEGRPRRAAQAFHVAVTGPEMIGHVHELPFRAYSLGNASWPPLGSVRITLRLLTKVEMLVCVPKADLLAPYCRKYRICDAKMFPNIPSFSSLHLFILTKDTNRALPCARDAKYCANPE